MTEQTVYFAEGGRRKEGEDEREAEGEEGAGTQGAWGRNAGMGVPRLLPSVPAPHLATVLWVAMRGTR